MIVNVGEAVLPINSIGSEQSNCFKTNKLTGLVVLENYEKRVIQGFSLGVKLNIIALLDSTNLSMKTKLVEYIATQIAAFAKDCIIQ